MADVKTSALAAATTLSPADFFPFVQGGVTKRGAISLLLAMTQAPLGFTPENAANRNQPNGYPGLAGGKLDPSVIPALSYNTRWPVASQTEMLALNAALGDIAVRSDTNTVWLLTKTPASTLANWTNLGISAVGISSLLSATGATKTGDVKVTPEDIWNLSDKVRAFLAANTSADLRTVLGLGTAATQDSGAFATASHGHAAATPTTSGFMSAADKVRLDNLVAVSGGVPTAMVARFPKTIKAVPEGYLALTSAIQKVPKDTYPSLDAALGLVLDPGLPTAYAESGRLQASDAAQNDYFGHSVAISSDGNTLAVGTPTDDNSGGTDAGSVYVFIRTGSTWAQQIRLQASDAAPTDWFGHSVAISSDGNTLAVGAVTDDNSGGTDAGSVYVFIRTGSTWAQQNRLQAPDAAENDRFGQSVALSSDGNTLAVGAYLDDNSGGNDAGSAYVFTRTGATWSPQSRLQASDAAPGDDFGCSIALSADGNTLAVGAFFDDNSGGTNAGSAYVFTRTGSTWAQQTRVQASDAAANDRFGHSVAISSDGNTLAVGAVTDDNSGGTDAGSVYVFIRTGSTWAQQNRLQAPDAAPGDNFGDSVALSADGNTLAAGASSDDNTRGSDVGSVYVFTRTGATWSLVNRLQPSDGAESDSFGRSVSLAADGNTVSVGSPFDNNSGGADAGSVYISIATSNAPGVDKLNLPARPDSDWTWAIKL